MPSARCSRGVPGDIFQWINSDDVLLPGALLHVGGNWKPGHAVVGQVTMGATMDDAALFKNLHLSPITLIEGSSYLQPGVWMPRDGMSRAGLNLNLHYAFDLDMMIRYLMGPHGLCFTEAPLVFFRLHGHSKTVSNPKAFDRERLYIIRAALNAITDPSLKATCRGILQRFVWHRWVDRVSGNRGIEGRKRIRRLLALAARKPRERLDRYLLGRVRRLIFER